MFDSIEFHELDETFIPNLSAVGDFGRWWRSTRPAPAEFFFSGRIHMQFHMNITPGRTRRSYDEMVDMGMKALVEEAAANSGASAGAGKDWEHVEIRQCAWWLVALATLLLLD